MSTPQKYEMLKRHILMMCPENARREVMFFGPERRKNSVKIAVSNVEGINIEHIQREMRGCKVFVRANARGVGSRIDIYVPCNQAPFIVQRTLVCFSFAVWATFIYLCWVVQMKQKH